MKSTEFVQQPSKQFFTRFYQLYDLYCGQFENVLRLPVVYQESFSFTASKVCKTRNGFIGKDLYQFASIQRDPEAFIQWVESIRRGKVVFARFGPYVIILFYYLINRKLFPQHPQQELALMCKLWEHYEDAMPQQDASLILGWIKDYWMLYCQEIPFDSFKSLFKKDVVFLNEFSVSKVYKSGLLAFYNDVCYYRVLHGKIVEHGYRSLLERILRVVSSKLTEKLSEYNVSFSKMMAIVSGKDQYVFLRAIVLPNTLNRFLDRTHVIITESEQYFFERNSRTNRYRWTFDTQGYNKKNLVKFFEHIIKAIEAELRGYIDIGPSTSSLEIADIYTDSEWPSSFAAFLNDDKREMILASFIQSSVDTVCAEEGIRRISGSQDTHLRKIEAQTIASPETEYEGVDPNHKITRQSLEDARRVLIQNQNKLVFEDDEEPDSVSLKSADLAAFTNAEKRLLAVLLAKEKIPAGLYKLEAQGFAPGVLIQSINEKAIDRFGDVLIDDTSVPPVIIEDYRELCEEALKSRA